MFPLYEIHYASRILVWPIGVNCRCLVRYPRLRLYTVVRIARAYEMHAGQEKIKRFILVRWAAMKRGKLERNIGGDLD